MVKKKLFAALSIATVAIAGVGAIALSNNIDFVSADEKTQTVVLNAETGLSATSDAGTGHVFDFVATGLTETEGKLGTLAAGGFITLAEGHSLNQLRSFAVTTDKPETITLSYGFEEGTWVREGLTGWVSTSGEASLLNEHPNYIGLGATEDAVIESIAFTFANDGAKCQTAEPTPAKYAGTNWTVVGTHQGWDVAAGTEFTLNSKNREFDFVEYMVTLDLLEGAKFKIIENGDWDTFKQLEIVGSALTDQLDVPPVGDGRGGTDIYVKKSCSFKIYLQVGETTKVVIPEAELLTNPVDKDDESLVKTVYFKAPTNWATTITAHYFDYYGNDTTWPGEAMTVVSGNKYFISYNTAFYTRVKFTDGTNETIELVSPVDDKVCYVYNKGWYVADTDVEPDAPATDKLFLKPNSNWIQGNAWFAAYIWGTNPKTWVKMTDSDSDGIYEMDKPAAGFENIIFCRMNPSKSALDWGSKWDQTVDLKIPTNGNNLFTVNSDAWNDANGVWSTK